MDLQTVASLMALSILSEPAAVAVAARPFDALAWVMGIGGSVVGGMTLAVHNREKARIAKIEDRLQVHGEALAAGHVEFEHVKSALTRIESKVDRITEKLL
jgi:hypothetical protein